MAFDLKRFLKSEKLWSVGLVVLVTLITYGPLIPKLGYYQDDWYLTWSGVVRGAQSIAPLFANDRPVMGYVYMLDYMLLGPAFLNWHLWALFPKLVGALAFLWLLRMLWPRLPQTTTAAAVIFVVYPGFLSQPIANTFQNHLFGYAAGIISIALTVRLVQAEGRAAKVGLGALAFLFAALYLPIYEYMIGLEFVRLLMVWLALGQGDSRPWQSRLPRLAAIFAPFAALSAAFVYWRFFIFEATRAAASEEALLAGYAGSPLYGLLTILVETGKDILDTSLFAWAVPAYRYYIAAGNREMALAAFWALLAIALVAGYFYLARQSKAHEAGQTERLDILFIVVGLLSVAAALLPVVFAGRQVAFNGFERYTLQASMGVALLFAGLLLAVKPDVRLGLVLALVALGVSVHYLNANYWAEKWEIHRQTWWQLSYRAPGIKPGTLAFVQLPSGYRFEQEYEAWGAINLIYYPDENPPAVLAEMLNSDSVARAADGQTYPDKRRNITFQKDFSKVLVMSMPTPESCLHVIDGALPFLSEYEVSQVAAAAPYSDLELVLAGANPAQPPAEIFGAQPAQDWCYFYQQAALARQQGDWARITEIGAQAASLGLEPHDRVEWMPFFEAYVNLGDFEQARQIAKALKGGGLRQSLCAVLAETPDYAPAYNYDYATVVAILCD